MDGASEPTVIIRPFPIVPASFFGIPLGTLALGILWQTAGEVWPLPNAIEQGLIFGGTVIWCILAALWVAKWVVARSDALVELEHPVQCCFIGLACVTALMVAIGLAHSSIRRGGIHYCWRRSDRRFCSVAHGPSLEGRS
jgi:tellurite resistance protein TehA-like permease